MLDVYLFTTAAAVAAAYVCLRTSVPAGSPRIGATRPRAQRVIQYRSTFLCIIESLIRVVARRESRADSLSVSQNVGKSCVVCRGLVLDKKSECGGSRHTHTQTQESGEKTCSKIQEELETRKEGDRQGSQGSTDNGLSHRS